MKLYLKTTTDDLELPIAVAESPGELAKILGTSKNSVLSCLGHHCAGWIRLEVEDEEEVLNHE